MKQEYRYLGVLKTKIMKKLWKDHQYTRKELCDMLDIAWTTMFDNLNAMKKRGIVEKIKGIMVRGEAPQYIGF